MGQVVGPTERAAMPSGTVTFLFTDVEGSTREWASDPAAMAESLRHHDEIVRREIGGHGGVVFATGGDGFAAAFVRPSAALAAAGRVQTCLAEADWPGPRLRVRVGIHLGEAEERGRDYFGPAVNTAARVASVGHGGQVLVTDVVKSVVGVEATDLGSLELRGIPVPVQLWQVGDGTFAPLRTATARSYIPTPPTRILGRDDDVLSVRLMLAEHRLVSLVAIGGTGKTRLALEVADAESAHWRDGVWFVDLTQATAGREVVPAIAKAIGFEGTSGDRSEQLTSYLRTRDLLLVLDNCEHVVDACADVVTDILTAGGRSKVLATSRERLDIDGERVHQVAPLDTDGARSPAVRLFEDRAAAVSPGFAVDHRNAEQVTALCRRLDGAPLAIELAASRVPVMTPAQLLDGLDDRFRTLSGRRRRQRRGTLEATIDWSYDLLAPDEQRVFRALGVFAGAFDVEAVAAVSELSVPDATDVLEVLFARSLVVPSSATNRFRLLETLKAYAERALVDAGERDSVRALHCAHFRHLGRADTLLAAWERDRCVALLPDVGNLLLAADWLESNRRWEDLAEHLFGIAFVSGDDAGVMLARLNRCRRRVAHQHHIDDLCHAAIFSTMALADWTAYIEATAELRKSPNPTTAAFGYLYLALVTARHAPDDAHSLIDRFAELAGEDPPGDHADHQVFWRSMVEAMSGDLDTAADLARRVVDRPVGRTSLGLNAQLIVGAAAWAHGDPAPFAAVADLLEAAYRDTGRLDPFYETIVGFARCLVLLASGDLDAARAALRHQARDVVSGRVALVDGDALGLLAELARREGDDDRARELIMSTGAGRSPGTVGVLRAIANRLGVGDRLQEEYNDHVLDEQWLAQRPQAALLRELERRSWLAD